MSRSAAAFAILGLCGLLLCFAVIAWGMAGALP